MSKTDPIKNTEDIRRLKDYFLHKNQYRNYAMVTVALNTSLRIGDLLGLTWGMYTIPKQEDTGCTLF